jgi:ribonuclease HII
MSKKPHSPNTATVTAAAHGPIHKNHKGSAAALQPSWREEEALLAQGYGLVAGVDEAGRGPLAGPVVAAAVVLPYPLDTPWLFKVNDSKRLSPPVRERLYPLICDAALCYGVGTADNAEVDALGIVEATRRAMLRAIQRLEPQPQALLIDFVRLQEARLPFRAIVHGDARCYSIAAASVVAKVWRDRLMGELDHQYPGYGFARNKGYPTPGHVRQLRNLGPSPVHRRSFLPVRRLLEVGHA